MTEQSPTPPRGERRRRREAERKAAQASTEQSPAVPMTRRERRALEEALASGALELTPEGEYAPTGEVPTTTSGMHVLSGADAGGETASSAGSAAEPEAEPGSATEPEAEPGPTGQVSRRSLRERQDSLGPSAPVQPSELAATSRRPVIRPPVSAQNTRSVDETTGELTAVQRANRDINAAPEDPPTDAVLQRVDLEPEDAPSPEEDDFDDSFDLRPQWPSMATAAEHSAEADSDADVLAQGDEVDPADEGDHADEADVDEERHTPRMLQALYWIVLVLAGVVLGLLVWRMATGDLFGDGGALAVGARMLVLRQ